MRGGQRRRTDPDVPDVTPHPAHRAVGCSGRSSPCNASRVRRPPVHRRHDRPARRSETASVITERVGATPDERHGWAERPVLDAAGTPIGRVVDVYLDAVSESDDFVAVRVGRLRRRRVVLVPLADAVVTPTSIRVMCGHKLAEAAPGPTEDGRLEPGAERRLFEHYGLSYESGRHSTTRLADGTEAPRLQRAARSTP